MQLKRLAYDLIKRFVAVGLLNVVHVCITEGLMEDSPTTWEAILRRNLLPHEQQKPSYPLRRLAVFLSPF